MGLPPWGDHGSPPYETKYGQPSYDVCVCCGFEFGSDDNPGTSIASTFESYLVDWKHTGCPWFEPDRRPSGWDLDTQLRNADIDC